MYCKLKLHVGCSILCATHYVYHIVCTTWCTLQYLALRIVCTTLYVVHTVMHIGSLGARNRLPAQGADARIGTVNKQCKFQENYIVYLCAMSTLLNISRVPNHTHLSENQSKSSQLRYHLQTHFDNSCSCGNFEWRDDICDHFCFVNFDDDDVNTADYLWSEKASEL